MNEQSPVNQSETLDRREEHPADPSRAGTWIAGVILIGLGTMFLMQNMGSFTIPLTNWWALFILIPAVGALDTALRTYRSAGNRFTASARGSLLVGLVLTFVTIVLLFNLSWSYFGPIIIILVGISILSGALFEKH